MGSSSSNPLGNKFNVVHVPDVPILNIPDARYASYDPEKKTDAFSTIKREFETHVKTIPEQSFKFTVPTTDPGIDEKGKVTPFVQYAEKLCKEARKKKWKCDVENFGDTIKIILDK
jgi:hypothetical protein